MPARLLFRKLLLSAATVTRFVWPVQPSNERFCLPQEWRFDDVHVEYGPEQM
jgi:hypothetical protein